MPLYESYAIWNNKGGVGKSTITYHVASRYAEQHPEKKVLVIDLCPQSNVSMMLLGGGTNGEALVLGYCTEPVPKTVVGYMSTVLAGGAGAPLPAWRNFLVTVRDRNASMPSNLYLLCGDGNLEPMAPLISAQAAAAPLTPSSNPWKWVHETIRTLIAKIAEEDDATWIVFVDTNPSFSIYTEIAVSSVNRLIVPTNADDSSRVATTAMFTLIHGAVPPHPIYGAYTYAVRADAAALARPQVHLIVGNRLTQNVGPAAAFGAVSNATAESMYEAYRANPARFTTRSASVTSIEQFRNEYSIPLRDFNTAGVVSAHRGVSLSQLPSGKYDVYGTGVTIDNRRVQECLGAVDDLVAHL